MEDLTEQIAALLQQTRNSLLKWEVRSRDEDGKPDSWRTTTQDGQNYSIGVCGSLMDDPVEDDVEHVIIDGGDPGRELCELLASMFGE